MRYLLRSSCSFQTIFRLKNVVFRGRIIDGRREGSSSRTQLFLLALKSCGIARDMEVGKFLHSRVTEGFERLDMYVGNSIVNMYAKCGDLEGASIAFERMPVHDIVSWNALMTGFADNGDAEVALGLYTALRRESNDRTLVAALKACTALAAREDWKKLDDQSGRLVKVESLKVGSEIYGRAVEAGCDSDVFVMNSVVDMYAKCGCMVEARRVFDKMVDKDVVSWNALLLGYAENCEGEIALELFFSRMRCAPNHLTFVAALKACAAMAAKERGTHVEDGRVVKLEALGKGMLVHSQVRHIRYDSNILVASGLMAMYAKCRSLQDARMVFDKMPFHDLVSWNVLVLGYDENEQEELVLKLLARMTTRGCPITLVVAAKACCALAEKEEGKMVDGKLVKLESLEKAMIIHSQATIAGYDSGLFLATSLVNLYAKCGSMEDARRVFEAMALERTTAACNALILGYVENREEEQALKFFLRMKTRDDSRPDELSFVAALKACGGITAEVVAKQIYGEICRLGLESSPTVGNALIDTLGRCGCVAQAHELFSSLGTTIDSVTWTALIAGYGRQGNSELVFGLFDQMLLEGVKPDKITFNSVLSACSHAGLVDRGRKLFHAMTSSKFGIKPDVEHYTCLIDMLGRANELELAVEVLNSMPVKADACAWTTLLAACSKWKNVAVGNLAYESLLKIDENDPSSYVLMSNICG